MRNKINRILAVVALSLLVVFSISVFAQSNKTPLKEPLVKSELQDRETKEKSCGMMEENQKMMGMMGMMERCNKMMGNSSNSALSCCSKMNDADKHQELKMQKQKENKSDNIKDKPIEKNK